MTKLTGLAKAMLGLLVGGAVVAAFFTHGHRLKSLISGVGGTQATPATSAGVKQRPPGQFVLGLCEWPGHMPFVLANGGLTTQPNSAVANEGLDLKIVFIEDPIKKNKALLDGTLDAVWSTVDEMPISMATYRAANVSVKAFMQIDWSRGGDACVTTSEIKSVEDIFGKKSSMLMFSPEHTLFEFMITNSRLTQAQLARVRADVTFSTEDPLVPRKLFVDRKVDVACVWEPDLSLAVTSRPGAHRFFSTADATELLADVLLVKQDLLDNKPALLEKIARVWFEGAAKADADRPAAAKFISSVVPRFRDELGREQTLRSFDWVRWTDLSDNVKFYGLDNSKPAFDRVYNQADAIWMNYPQAEIKDRFAPVALRDDRIVRRIWETAGRKVASRSEKYQEGTALTGTAVFSKPISINFRGGSWELDAEAMAVLNSQLLPQIETARGMYLRVEGNTDSVGSSSANLKLSERRAKAIAEYLVTRGVDRARIIARGNGSARPIASNKTPEGRALNRRTEVLFIPSRRSPPS
jgi:outer membrane protein OmpA-like peptidoglycan-associated protein/ABC-type nitrate/sulfonate/bicarbonate transport system substrate-binding protein